MAHTVQKVKFMIGAVAGLVLFAVSPIVHAAELTIDDATFDATVQYGTSPMGVFISDAVGYVFYVDDTSDVVYRKTENGGNTWGDPVVLSPDKTWNNLAVWYDQWTPGDSGTKIHIVATEGGTDDTWYNSVDTGSSDAISGWVVVDLSTSRANPDGAVSIAKSTDGHLFISTFRSAVLGGAAYTSTTGGASWSSISPTGLDDDDDHAQFVPLSGGDMLFILWDETAATIQSNVWDEPTDTWEGWTTIDSSLVTDTSFDAVFSAVISQNTGNVFLAYNNDTDATTGDIKFWEYDDGTRTWEEHTDIATDIAEAIDVALAIDATTDDIYAFYIRGGAAGGSTHVYYKVSADGGVNWSAETQISTRLDDLRIVRTMFSSNERIYVFWFNDDLNDILGEIIANLFPPIPEITVTATSNQADAIQIGSPNNYVATFEFIRGTGTANITNITFTESGSVNAYTELSNIKLWYETADTCSFDGNETLFGVSSTFNASDEVTINGTMSVGTSQVCGYVTLQASTGAYRDTLELTIQDPSTMVTVSAGTVAPNFTREVPGTTYIGKEVMIDDSIFDATDEYNPSPATVFIGTSTGYVLYIDSTGDVAYRKTTNGGGTWSGAIVLSPNKTWANVAVWYDQWTPGDSGTKIHIAAVEADTDDIWYYALDTNGDTLDSDGWTAVITGTTYTPATSGGPSITKATDGTLFLLGFTNTFGAVYKSSDGNSWSDTSVGGAIDDADVGQILPLSSGDILLITQDISLNVAQSKVYTSGTSSWDASWTTIDTWAENATYDAQWGASLNRSTGDIYLAGNTMVLNENSDMAAYKYDESLRSWSALADIIEGSPYILQGTMAIDENTGDLYAFYLAGAIADTMNVFFKRSEDDGQTWSIQSRALNIDLGDDFKNLRTDFMNADRLHAIWYNDDLNYLQGTSILFRDPNGVEAYVIDPTGGDATAQYNPSPNTVFVSDQVGYIFYVDSTTDVVYRKTTNGGRTWGAANALSPDKTWLDVAVWYDQWTMDDSGTKIHLVASESDTDGIWYYSFDTSDESLDADGWLSVFDMDVLSAGADGTSTITKSTTGNLFIGALGRLGASTSTSGVYKSVDGGDTWSDTSFAPSAGVQNTDQMQLLPLATGDDVLMIYQDVSANNLLSLEYDETTDAWTNEQIIDNDFAENATYDAQWGASYYKETGDIYIAGMNAIALSTGDLETYKMTESSRSWSTLSNVLTDVADTTQGKIWVDDSNGDLYVAYNKLRSGQVLPNAMTIFYTYSSDGGSSWSDAIQLSTTEDDLKYIRGNLTSNERLYASWFNDDLNDVIGNTVMDLTPESVESSGDSNFFWFFFGE